jgi:hypothetical protein
MIEECRVKVKCTNIAERARIKDTEILVLGFICRFQTIKPGRMQQVQSVRQVTPEYTYVETVMICGSMQLPCSPVLLHCPQK